MSSTKEQYGNLNEAVSRGCFSNSEGLEEFCAVFQYYKALINLLQRGNPQSILRTVNPRESELLDAAAGVFIRFRLGGDSFPPSIYYKIFTHLPIIDPCAQSEILSTNSTKMEVNQMGRYQRIENNNWRLFSSMSVSTRDTAETEENKRIDFHYSKLQRQQDVLRRRREKKINGLKQMYNQGRLECQLGQVASLVDDTAKNVLSDALNFEESSMATSMEQYHKAASVIQRAWRSSVFKAVFQYYKALINLLQRGNPQSILRTVNPRESELLDAAAGVFIRLRLGGASFPRNIYFKIFTHLPIIDLCAQSEVNQMGRYQRIVNNNWRLLSNMVNNNMIVKIMVDTLQSVSTRDSVESEESKKIDFHFSKLQRQQDVLQRRREKKINWLKQMYNRGRLESGLGQVVSLVDDTAKNVLSDTLNFEEYVTQWSSLACSESSATTIGPFHYSLTTEPKSMSPY